MSTFLEVEHITSYRYARPVEFGRHRVMFRPRAAHDIHLISASLEVTPTARLQWVHDVFSNSVALVDPLLPAAELRFTARFTIEHFGVQNLELEVDPEARDYPFRYSDEDQLNLAPYLPLQYPDDAAVVGDWVRQFLPARGLIHSRDLLRNIAEGIRADLTYQSRDAMGTQRPAETLALQSGTCRDYALLMMEAARGLGFAARFVSGYLYDPSLDGPPPAEQGSNLPQSQSQSQSQRPDGTRQVESVDEELPPVQGAGATHAWLHVYLPGAGWVPFDPTNSIFGGTDLIRVAYTRTPEQAAPIAGSWFGAGDDYEGIAVRVSVRKRDPADLADATHDACGEP